MELCQCFQCQCDVRAGGRFKSRGSSWQERTLSTRAVLPQVGQAGLQRRFAARHLLLVGLLLAHQTES